MSKIIISLDVGKFDTKAVGKVIDESAEEIKKICFRTKKYDLKNGFIDVEGENSYKVVYDGNEYIIGEQGEDKSYDTSKTNLLHKVSAYTAITQFLEPSINGKNENKNEIYMVLACPLSVLQIQEKKEEYKEFIKDNVAINIEVNDQHYTFEIKDITIKAEGSGILYLEQDLFKNKNMAIIDLGGLNMGFSLYRNGSCKKEDRFIEECGANELTELVREQLVIYKGGNLVSYDQTEQALEKGYLAKMGSVDTESVQYINMGKEKYYKKVMSYIKAHGYKLEELDGVVFVGGTSQKIKEIISKELEHSYIPSNAQLSTVEGLYKVAFVKYGKQ